MPFPLPIDPDFRKEIAMSWLEDVEERVRLGDMEGASVSLSEALNLILSLPPGKGSTHLEKTYIDTRVKLEQAQLNK